MTYYNQNDYGKVPYPAPGYESATVKSGGCAVCCGSTLLSLFNVDYPPGKLAPIFIAQKARVSGGTDMKKAAQIICELGGLEYSASSAESELIAHLMAGGAAIANVGGDRAGYTGVFSTGGHYICVIGVKQNGDLLVFDVGDYTTPTNKYGSSYRASKVKREGQLLICSADTLDADTKNREPNYYLFKRKVVIKLDNTPDAYAKEAVEKALQKGALKGDDKGNLKLHDPITRQDMLVILDRLGLIK